jgi:ribosomal protein S18 acetylase RimI-like enzyme
MTTARIVVRPMRADDAEDVRDLDRLILGDDRSSTWDAHVARFLDMSDYDTLIHPPMGCFVARQANRLLGFILSETQAGEYGLPRGLWIVAVGVHPDARRHGVGRLLVDHLVRQCEKSGVTDIYAVLRPEDDRDIAFLRSCGLSETPITVLGRRLKG